MGYTVKKDGRFKKGIIPWNKGKTVWYKGRKLTEEHKKRIGESNKGKKHGQGFQRADSREKISKSLMGHIVTEETRNKLRIAKMSQPVLTKQTKIEKIMAQQLDFMNIKYTSNKALEGVCYPDFFINPNIVIFCDGDYWHNLPNYIIRDRRINETLLSRGYIVLRFWEKDIHNNLGDCLLKIKKAL